MILADFGKRYTSVQIFPIIDFGVFQHNQPEAVMAKHRTARVQHQGSLSVRRVCF